MGEFLRQILNNHQNHQNLNKRKKLCPCSQTFFKITPTMESDYLVTSAFSMLQMQDYKNKLQKLILNLVVYSREMDLQAQLILPKIPSHFLTTKVQFSVLDKELQSLQFVMERKIKKEIVHNFRKFKI